MKPILLLLLLTLSVSAQTSAQSSQAKIADHVRSQRGVILAELVDFLKLENVAHNTPKGHADIQRNAEYIVKLLEKRGLKTQILNVDGGFPAVYGELLTPGATKTVVFYAHYDGQPVVPAQWKTPAFEPSLVDTAGKPMPLNLNPGIVPDPARGDQENFRLFARGASDDKAGVLGLIAAIDALKATGVKPSINIKLFFEGEEEAGSEHLASILAKHAELLMSDLWILCDGPVHQSGKLQLVYGARGVMGLELTVYGPNRALHSGHYGNWAPNPALDLAHLLASMRDKDGRITIPGFYDTVQKPTPEEEKALAAFPNVDAALQKELKLGRTLGRERIERSVMMPAFNIRGIRAGNVGEAAANAVMTEASASIDFRLVPGQTLEKVKQQVENFLIHQQGYVVTNQMGLDGVALGSYPKVALLRWQPGYPPMRTSFEAPAAQAMVRTIEAAFPKQVPLLRLPTLGGSVPMYIFERQFKTPVMILPIANYDNNQHASNENIRLGNLWQGIELYAALMAELGNNWKDSSTKDTKATNER
jgi:acetylornithine deacetylase/succinyl-diaminopimelate desuccinylase-like protein